MTEFYEFVKWCYRTDNAGFATTLTIGIVLYGFGYVLVCIGHAIRLIRR
jgi:hypothetical protein